MKQSMMCGLALALVGVGCGDDDSRPMGGTDAGRDSSVMLTDAAPQDAARVDAGAVDASAVDAGSSDAGSVDAFVPVDAFVGDAGPPERTAYRITTLALVDPHAFTDLGTCLDVTDGAGFTVNGSLATELEARNVNWILLFDPLDEAAASTPFTLYGGATCTAGAGGAPDDCEPGTGTETASTAHNTLTGASCFTADPTTLTAGYTAPPEATAPCFVTDEHSFNVEISGAVVPLHKAKVAASYASRRPVSTLVRGTMMGFVTVTDAMAATLPEDLPLVGGDSLYEHLAAGMTAGASCSTNDDRDMTMIEGVMTSGFWVYFQFEASRANFTEPL